MFAFNKRLKHHTAAASVVKFLYEMDTFCAFPWPAVAWQAPSPPSSGSSAGVSPFLPVSALLDSVPRPGGRFDNLIRFLYAF